MFLWQYRVCIVLLCTACKYISFATSRIYLQSERAIHIQDRNRIHFAIIRYVNIGHNSNVVFRTTIAYETGNTNYKGTSYMAFFEDILSKLLQPFRTHIYSIMTVPEIWGLSVRF